MLSHAMCGCVAQTYMDSNYSQPPNKGHFGNNINSSLLSFVERLSSSLRFKMY